MINYIVHRFLKIEVETAEEANEDVGDLLECFVPKYLYREQYRKCCKVFNDLLEWTSDTFLHSMTAFHELILFHFLNYLAEYQKDIGNKVFKKIYFDKQSRDLIYKAISADVAENQDSTMKEWREFYSNPFDIMDLLFEDTDFFYNIHPL